jgi:2-dehydropantoate 2-reductase
LKIAMLGAGALGCSMGSALAETGVPVWLINRRVGHVEAIRRRGLRVRDGAREIDVRVAAASDAAQVRAEAGTMDLVVVLVKSFHTRQAMTEALPLVGPQTAVLTLQNGLGHEELLAEVVGPQRVLAGKTYCGGVMLGEGHVARTLQGRETIIGELDGSVSARVQEVAQVFGGAGIATQVSSNIVGAMWDKLFVNVATGALSAITRLDYGGLYSAPEVEACALAAVAEAMRVARAQGVRISSDDPRQSWAKAAAGLPSAFKASMLQSLEKGSVTEIDFVNGAVVEQGRRVGIPTPVNQTLVACVKGIERALPSSAGASTRH